MRFLWSIVLLAGVPGWVVAEKATVVRYETRVVEGGEVQAGTMYFGDHRMKIQPSAAGGRQQEIIYRGDRKLVWIIDHEEKSYYQMDKKSMEQMAEQFAGIYKRMEERLAQLPPEERAQAEKMLQSQMPPPSDAPPPDKQLRATGQRRQINGYTCAEYELISDGNKESEIWVTNTLASDVDRMVYVMKSMGKFYDQLTRSMPGRGAETSDLDFQELGKLQGFPILVRNFSNGELQAETNLRDIRDEDLGSKVFELPSGYQKLDLFNR